MKLQLLKASIDEKFVLEINESICLDVDERDGAFVAVPLFRVNTAPIGPHPVGSYEIWVPQETFSAVFSYLCMNRGNLSILVHPLTREQSAEDHDTRVAWIGPSYPLDLTALPLRSEEIPLQYPSLRLGYSAKPQLTLEMRMKLGANVEHLLASEKEAARAPPRV
ncbi:DOPA 4,5-dioxygenase [Psilocybe cubensis]|uniref:DOPA 4,5-dioxygenase n=1 Tax=Psilocybe cubensis TaxID=181762 RepID=A0ACB8H7D7_PSICU|nr:DOPA 4,5-dioxygenase [Psilocybe cubensis]KAH9483587.1 DOPA 4,5-dioxygenase [Psilocybe cubensis]